MKSRLFPSDQVAKNLPLRRKDKDRGTDLRKSDIL